LGSAFNSDITTVPFTALLITSKILP